MSRRLLCGGIVWGAVLFTGLACESQTGQVVSTASVALPAPIAALVLPVNSSLPLDLDHFEVVDTAVWAIERQTSDVWRFIIVANGSLDAQMMVRGGERGMAPIVGAGRVSDGIVLFLRDRRFVVVDTDSGSYIRSGVWLQGDGVLPLDMAPLTDSTHAVLAISLVRDAPDHRIVSMSIRDTEGREVSVPWRSDRMPGTGAGALFDQSALAVVDDLVLISGSQPPRFYRVSAALATVDTILLQSPPLRAVPAEVRRAFAQALRAAPRSARAKVELPDVLPAVLSVYPHGKGIAATAISGGTTGEAQGLDWYCGGSFTRTLVGAPSVVRLGISAGRILMVREMEQGGRVLEMYLLDSFDVTC